VRVLYVNHTAEISGGERSLLSLLAGLPDTVHARVATPRGRLAAVVDELGISVSAITGTAGSLRLHPLHTPRALAEMGLAAAQVRRLAHRHGVEILHANSIRAGIVVGLARSSQAANVVCVRDCLPPGPVTTATMRLIGATASTVVANSRYTARFVETAAPRARVDVVHNPVDLTRWNPTLIDRDWARARLGEARAGGLLLGVVAQLSPWKGHDTAIEALALARDQGVDAHLLLIGSAKFVDRATRFDNQAYVARLKALICDAGLEGCVSWLGEREDVPELVRALDVLLLPSWEEPFGRVLIEAMAMRVPVIATDVGGPSEFIQDGCQGYLLAPGEPSAWAQAIGRFAEDPERGRRMGEAGRRTVEGAFTVEHHVAEMLRVYEGALDATAGDRRARG
jgi:L-malate glycosyltransferase